MFKEHINQLLRIVTDLDLSAAGKLSLSDRGFCVFDDLTTLNISNGHITSLKASWFSKHNQIVHLNASHNSLRTTDRATLDALRALSHLSKLDLSYNDIDNYAANTFHNLPLTELIIRHNGLQRVSAFGHLPNIRILDLSDNSLKQVICLTIVDINTSKFKPIFFS